MKKYAEGGVPEGIKNVLLDREQEREREAFEKARRAENEAPKRSVIDALSSFVGKEKDKKKKEPKKMAQGGYVRKADGCAQRGKTKGRMV